MSPAIYSIVANPIIGILLSIGVFGWWRVLAKDSIFNRPRNWFYLKWPHEGFTSMNKPKRGYSVYSGGAWYTQKGAFWGELLNCALCAPFWLGILMFVLYVHFPAAAMISSFIHVPRTVTAFLAKHID
jgi:hypothetical protein